MSKTFKSAKSTLELTVVRTNEDLVRIITQLPDETGRAIDLAQSDAPALALAILEAAGVEATDPASKQVRFGTPEHLGHIAFELRRYAEWEAKHTAEAEDQAKLEAEALELFNARQEAINSVDWEPYKDFATEDSKQTWIAVARRAREINKEEK